MSAEDVYKLVAKIPKGRVTTYGIIARKLGRPNCARAIGAILRANKHPIVIPCHRVVKSNGEIGGYFGRRGIKDKIELLRSEGVHVEGRKILLRKYIFTDF